MRDKRELIKMLDQKVKEQLGAFDLDVQGLGKEALNIVSLNDIFLIDQMSDETVAEYFGCNVSEVIKARIENDISLRHEIDTSLGDVKRKARRQNNTSFLKFRIQEPNELLNLMGKYLLSDSPLDHLEHPLSDDEKLSISNDLFNKLYLLYACLLNKRWYVLEALSNDSENSIYIDQKDATDYIAMENRALNHFVEELVSKKKRKQN